MSRAFAISAASFQGRSPGNQDPVAPVRAAPFGCLGWPMLLE